VHTHQGPAEVVPGEIYRVEVEIWPTSLVLPPGYSLGLSVQGRDYENPNLPPIVMSNFKNQMTGAGPFLHDDPRDRPAPLFDGTTTVHVGPDTPSSLLIPFVPAAAAE
jgi:predicted acyl esterase